MLVTTARLTFTEEGNRSVSVSPGTECMVFNRNLDVDPEAEELIRDAMHRNAVAGRSVWLVVKIKGRARLVKHTEISAVTAKPVEKPKRQGALF